MSAPKKGKDLSALKARLAKKAAAAEPEAPAASEAAPPIPAPGEVKADVPAPGEVKKPAMDIPAPGEVNKPADIPAPGEVSKPADIPAPGEVMQPEPAVAAAPAQVAAAAPKEDLAEDPFSGGVAFNPDAGLLDDIGGDVKPKSNIGLPIFAGIIGLAVGVGLGWMFHKSSDGGKRYDAAIAKADDIQQRVTEIEESRAKIALKLGEVEEAITAKDGDKAIAALEEFEPAAVEVGDLFGWQMAAMDPAVIKTIFGLAQSANNVQIDVSILKGWVNNNKDVLVDKIKGPSNFVVAVNPEAGGAVLAELVSAICDEIPDPLPEDFKPETLKKCEGEEILKAKAYIIRTDVGGDTSIVPGNQAFYLTPSGGIYGYAIGQTPEANAKAYFDLLMSKAKSEVDEMVKDKDRALEGIANYTSDPKLGGD
ncbi:hypothetical protein G6O69_26600 [Pseudenhygromyxa sp. WMMC2535]|uniref:hypothetical protein n=1 Tax=Pseudenhygromyxa sp. WMMC2535 TaxID=2712867 RepID=UPI0015567C00|nr:hypothetical protein [Pseudenhygromyxa sp. WMMC2535]NVB41437.1 hypothetical protein [Pseudenhygromyxa sp. WMMC2535]